MGTAPSGSSTKCTGLAMSSPIRARALPLLALAILCAALPALPALAVDQAAGGVVAPPSTNETIDAVPFNATGIIAPLVNPVPKAVSDTPDTDATVNARKVFGTDGRLIKNTSMNPPEITVDGLTGLLTAFILFAILTPGLYCLFNIQPPQTFEALEKDDSKKKMQ
jgi:hypothetical protein